MKNRNVRGRVLRSYAVSTVSMALVLFVLGIIGYMMTSLLAASHQVRQGVVMMVASGLCSRRFLLTEISRFSFLKEKRENLTKASLVIH